MRLKTTGCVHYGIENASGNGYWATVHIGGNLSFRYR